MTPNLGKYSTDFHLFVIKGTTQEQPNAREVSTRYGVGGVYEASMPSPQKHSPWKLEVIMEVSFCGHD